MAYETWTRTWIFRSRSKRHREGRAGGNERYKTRERGGKVLRSFEREHTPRQRLANSHSDRFEIVIICRVSIYAHPETRRKRMGYTALKPIAIVSIDREQEQGIPYQRRTRRAMRKAAAMPPTRPDRQRAPTSSTTNNGSNATGSNAGGKAQPPRPPNAWILYRSDKLKELATQQTSGPRKPQAEISKIISQMWQQEGPDTKGKYETREEKKAEHAALYPDYKFAPMKKEDKAMLRKAQRLEKEEIRQAERNRKKRKGKARADDDNDNDDDDDGVCCLHVICPLLTLAQTVRSSSCPIRCSDRPSPGIPHRPMVHRRRRRHSSTPNTPTPIHPTTTTLPLPLRAGVLLSIPRAGPMTPFRADAYQQDSYPEEEEWAGEEGEWSAEEAWAGRSRRGAVWDEEQIAGPSQTPSANGLRSRLLPPQQPQSLTITLPPSSTPRNSHTHSTSTLTCHGTFSGDPDANVAISLNDMNINESSSSSRNVGLNDLLRAPLPDIAVSFPDFVGNPDGHASFDVLSTENEEWWSALMNVAIPQDDTSYADSGPSQLMQSQPVAGPSYEPVAGPSSHQQQRPAPIHTQSLPTFNHGLPSPDGDHHHQGRRSRAASSAAYPGQMPGAFPEPSYQDSYQPQPQQYHQPPQQQEYNPSPFAQIASSRSNSGWRQPQQQQPQPPQQRSRAPSFPAPAPAFAQQQFSSAGAPFPSPSGTAQFPSPSGAGAFPSPSGAGAFPSPCHAPPSLPLSPAPSPALSILPAPAPYPCPSATDEATASVLLTPRQRKGKGP
ncbi:HMG (high mobility group) box protein [Rhizoctonia solani]|uniref:HMG (High mobility group) box protein n=1 Tax=Rhizoctonia solani TaxID=456999 RepID=A0A8H8T080_9AGAM|nr:HMG (high mobility group) box protein [Rhizoctonia solani]QRW24159.1 HMG (high mobility group) box protein [Rhizoctonia solani]